jgi:hypothetical protein
MPLIRHRHPAATGGGTGGGGTGGGTGGGGGTVNPPVTNPMPIDTSTGLADNDYRMLFQSVPIGHPQSFVRRVLDTTQAANPATTSAQAVAAMVRQVSWSGLPDANGVTAIYDMPYNTKTEEGAFAIPIYRVPLNQARVAVYVTDSGKRAGLAPYFANVPVPDRNAAGMGGRIEPSGTDGSIIVICGYEVWEFWGFRHVGDTGYESEDASVPGGWLYACRQGGYAGDYRQWACAWPGSSYFGGTNGYDWGTSATGISYSGMQLTTDDWQRGRADHALAFASPVTGWPTWGSNWKLPPAQRFDSFTYVDTHGQPSSVVDPYRLPEGIRFALPYTFDVDAWLNGPCTLFPNTNHTQSFSSRRAALATVGSNEKAFRIIIDAMQRHGIFLMDTTGGNLGFLAGSNKVHGTPYDPYPTETAVWGNPWQGGGTQPLFPWNLCYQVPPETPTQYGALMTWGHS